LIDQLTQEQQWGWAFELQQHNAAITEANARLAEPNSLLPEGEEPQEPTPLATMDEYLLLRLQQIGNAGYEAIIRIKEQRALAMFRALTPEQQAALVAQFQIPDVLES
jgi:hypothetical protein